MRFFIDWWDLKSVGPAFHMQQQEVRPRVIARAVMIFVRRSNIANMLGRNDDLAMKKTDRLP